MHDVKSHPPAWSNARVLALGALVTSVVAAVLLGMLSGGSSAANASRSKVVKTVRNSALKETILVNRRGMTLYHLSVEKRGKFICTSSACLSLWHPLVVPRGTTPTGARNLGTVKRPDGRLQVTYEGGPLYTFVQDRKPGDVRGNGFKDVGVWRPAVVGKAAASAPPGGGYGGGYGK
jgi:predicted lipoprotein with Yx(FWY)xxD motif